MLSGSEAVMRVQPPRTGLVSSKWGPARRHHLQTSKMFTVNLSLPGSRTSSLQNCETVTPVFYVCLLARSWTARRSNQFTLKEISPEYSVEELMLKLKLHSFSHLMRRADSLERPWCWERLRAGGEGDDRGWDSWMASLTQQTWVWVNSGSWWRTGRPAVLQRATH